LLTESSISSAIAVGISGILLATIGFALYLGLKSRGGKSGTSPMFTSGKEKAEGTASYTPASEVELADSFRWIDEVLGEVTVDGIQYRTFDAGEVYIYDKKKKPVIAFKVDGYMNAQRAINYIKISNDVEKEDGVIFYVKHNPQDFQLFQQWLDKQMYGGDYAREALYFKDLMAEIGKFNQLLASRKLRWKSGRYITY
jgi:hypothetical protein